MAEHSLNIDILTDGLIPEPPTFHSLDLVVHQAAQIVELNGTECDSVRIGFGETFFVHRSGAFHFQADARSPIGPVCSRLRSIRSR